MKKIIIGAIVGGLLIFIAQTLSWTVLNLHRNAQQYTPKQDSIINFLSDQNLHSGEYYMPTLPPGASFDESNKLMEQKKGKPWAIIAWHRSLNMNMGLNMLHGLAVNIIMVGLLVWILMQFSNLSFVNVLVSCIFVGLIIFLNVPYTTHIWYLNYGLKADFIDAVVGWGIAGIWLGWYLKRK